MSRHGWVFDGELPLEIFNYPYAWMYPRGTYLYYCDFNNPYEWMVLSSIENLPRWQLVPIEQVPAEYRAMLLLLT